MLDSTSKVLEDSARGGFYLTLGRSISGIVGALSLIVIARVLGSEQYGLYTISLAVPSLLLLFVNPGMNEGIIKFSASLRVEGKKEGLGNLLLHSLSFMAVLSFIAFAACYIFSDKLAVHVLNRPDVGGFVKLASISMVFQAILMTVNSAFVGLDKTEYNAATTVVQSVFKAIVALVLVILGFSVAGALIGEVSSFILACLLSVVLFVFKIYRPLNHPRENSRSFSGNLKMLASYGFPLYISVLLGGFTVQYRNILLSVFTSDREIGNFQAAMNFNFVMNSLSVPIATMLLPAFSKIEEKRKTVIEFFRISVKYTSIVILPVATLLMVYGEEMVHILYGDSYELAGTFLSLYIVTYFLVALGLNTLGSFFSGLGETRTNLKTTLLGSATLIALAPLLAWFLKARGIIMALILSALVGTLYGLYIARKSYSIQVDLKTTAKICTISLASAVPLLAMKTIPQSSDIISIVTGAAAYLAMYLLLLPAARVITSEELREIRSILEKVRPLRYLALPILYCEERIMFMMS